MITYIREIGPNEAEELLASNSESNRRVSDKVIYKYARAMDEGRFESLNGQTIVLGPDGKMYDGQHRMEAVALAGVTLPFLFVVDENAAENFKTVDQGRARVLCQFSKLPNKTTCDSIAKFGFCLDRGSTVAEALRGELPAIDGRIKSRAGKAPKPKPDMMELLDWEDEHAHTLTFAGKFGTSIYSALGSKGVIGSGTIGIAAYIILRYGNAWNLESFRRAAIADVGISKPAAGLTKSLRNTARDGKLTKELAIGFILADYAYFCDGEERKANMSTALDAFDIMARKIESSGKDGGSSR